MRLGLFIVSNWIIVLGYLVIAFYIAPFMEVKFWYTKLGGALFFLMCALTHMEHVIHAVTREPYGFTTGHVELHMLIIHLIQAFSVFVFIFGLYKEFVQGKGSWLRVVLNPGKKEHQ